MKFTKSILNAVASNELEEVALAELNNQADVALASLLEKQEECDETEDCCKFRKSASDQSGKCGDK
jgi:hypothetical protein